MKKVKHDKINISVSIGKEIMEFNYDLPTVHILKSNDDNYMFLKKE